MRHLQLGFTSSSLFVYKQSKLLLYILIYVDDIIITGNSPSVIQLCIQALGMEFAFKDLGSLHFLLGIEVSSRPTGLFLSQKKYILDLVHKTKMADAKPIKTPMGTSLQLSTTSDCLQLVVILSLCPTLMATSLQLSTSSDPLPSPTEYRSVVGALQYLLITHPDISFAVNKVAQFMHYPTTAHWTAVKQILRYLKSLSLTRSSNLCLNIFFGC